MDEKENFLSKINKIENGCWIWIGATTTRGHPVVWSVKRQNNAPALKVSYEIFINNENIKKVWNRCPNKNLLCVNPEHASIENLVCSIKECKNKYHSKGFCNRHYTKYCISKSFESPDRPIYNAYKNELLLSGNYICSNCKVVKITDNFYIDIKNKWGFSEWCRSCSGLASKNSGFKKNFGITLKEYNVLLEQQKFLCAICKEKDLKIRLAVDHDHKTGKIRGLLCSRCNLTLGKVKESIVILNKMIVYIKQYEEKEKI